MGRRNIWKDSLENPFLFREPSLKDTTTTVFQKNLSPTIALWLVSWHADSAASVGLLLPFQDSDVLCWESV